MIILDTNVLSELMKQAPDPRVVAWLDACPGNSVWTTSVTVFEIQHGLGILPDGRKRRVLEEAFDQVLQVELGGRVLDLDLAAAREAAAIAVKLRTAGVPVDVRDVLIAGTVAARAGSRLATRNTKDFANSGIALIDPWSAATP